MKRGTNKGRGSDIYKRFMVNFDEGSWLVLEAYKKMHPALSYSDCVRSMVINYASMMSGTNGTTSGESPDDQEANKELAATIGESNLIGKRYPLPENYKPGVWLTTCLICGGSDFYEDALTWNCNDCMWAGEMETIDPKNKYIIVTHKMKRKYERDAA